MGTQEGDRIDLRPAETGPSADAPQEAEPASDSRGSSLPDWLKELARSPQQPTPVASPDSEQVEATSTTTPAQSAGAADDTTVVEVDAAGLALLIESFEDYNRLRRADPASERDERQNEISQAICLTLVLACEAELDPGPQKAQRQTPATLQNFQPSDLPEARVCGLWQQLAHGQARPGAAEQLASLVRGHLWEPVRWLAYRALAYLGHRRLLADLLPASEQLTLFQADAMLEASLAVGLSENWLEGVEGEGILPSDLCDKWKALLSAEWSLAYRDYAKDVEKRLEELTGDGDDQGPATFARTVKDRLAARAAAACARARLAGWRKNTDVMNGATARFLPAWEREYLTGLSLWQRDDPMSALSAIKAAMRLNPNQTAIKRALAGLLAARSPDEALSALDHDEPTRDMFAARAQLLARRGRYNEADYALKRCDAAHDECARFSWARARKQSRQRENMLQAALLERRGDWNKSGKAWRAAFPVERQEQASGSTAGGSLWLVENVRKVLREARQLYQARLQLRSDAAPQGWLGSLLEQRLVDGCNDMMAANVAGDSMFFRAAAMMEILPGRAARDFRRLLRQRDWVEQERRAGSARILFAGDALMRLGQVSEAARAYELAGDPQSSEVKDRRAVAMIYTKILEGAEPEAVLQALDDTVALASSSHWPRLLGALALLMAEKPNEAISALREAAGRGAPEKLCRNLTAMCVALSGSEAMGSEALPSLDLPEESEKILLLLCGFQAGSQQVREFLDSSGREWVTSLITDPHLASQRLLSQWCDQGKWDEALASADRLIGSGPVWARELAALVRVRHALERACRGEVEEADIELRELETLMQRG
jgi:hypothetical protein